MDRLWSWVHGQREHLRKQIHSLKTGATVTYEMRQGYPVYTSAETLKTLEASLSELDALLAEHEGTGADQT